MRRFKTLPPLFIAMVMLMFGFPPPPARAAEAPADLAPQAVSAILMEASTGTVLFEKNAHEKLPPASITKIMTMLLIMEALQEGRITLDEMVRASEHAASMGGSQIFLEPGEQMSVRDLLKGIAVASGNDASVAMAEHIAGTEEAFVAMMNQKAEQLGMKNTHFTNASGLPAEGHYTTAYDIAVMSRELLKHEAITQFTGIYQDYLRQNSENPFWLVNTNKLVRFYEGVDGLKTGYTSEAGFCLSATAKRGDMRVIAVVMGEPDAKSRNREVSRLLDYAFANYTVHPLFAPGDFITQVRINKGEQQLLPLHASQQISILMKKGEKPQDYDTQIVLNEPLQAPLRRGESIGHIRVSKDGETVYTYQLTMPHDVKKASLWQLLKRTGKSMFLPFG